MRHGLVSFTSVALLVFLHSPPVHAQSNYPLTRIDSNNATASADSSSYADNVINDPASSTNSGEMLASAGVPSAANSGGAVGGATGTGSAGCLAAWDETVLVPQVDSGAGTGNSGQVSTGSQAGGESSGSGSVYTDWVVEPCSDPNAGPPVLDGYLSIYIGGLSTAGASVGGHYARARIGTNYVQAFGEAGDIWVMGSVNGVSIFEFASGGVDLLYHVSGATAVDAEIDLDAAASISGFADANATNPTSSGCTWDSHATAWFEVVEE